MATSLLIEPLTKGKDPERWLQRFEAVAKWQGLVDDKLKYAFLASIGAEVYDLLADAVLPKEPSDFKFEELCIQVKTQLQPKKLPIAARYDFCRLKQEEGDTVKVFVRKLRNAAEDCQFGTQLEDRLRDQLVFGISNKEARCKMLTEDLTSLTLDKAIQLAIAHEAVQTNQLRWNERPSVEVCRIKAGRARIQEQSTNRTASCKCCGRKNHEKKDCKFKNEACHICKKIGHLKSVCRLKDNRRGFDKSKSTVAQVKEEDIQDALLSFKIGESTNFTKNVKINGHDVSMLFDTAADVSIINEATFRKIAKGSTELQPVKRIVRDYNQAPIKLLGQASVKVEASNVTKTVNVLVVQGNTLFCIYGKDWITTFDPDFTVNHVSEGPTAELLLKEDAIPVFCKPRVLPFGIRDAVKEEIDRLVEEKILIPVSQSDWATPIVPIRKPSGKIRICGDYKVTLNPRLREMVSTTPQIEDLISNMNQSKWFSEIDLVQVYHQIPLDPKSSELTTISTTFGLFRYRCLPYGISNVPLFFKRSWTKSLRAFKVWKCIKTISTCTVARGRNTTFDWRR